jgi:hypothetical protein
MAIELKAKMKLCESRYASMIRRCVADRCVANNGTTNLQSGADVFEEAYRKGTRLPHHGQGHGRICTLNPHTTANQIAISGIPYPPDVLSVKFLQRMIARPEENNPEIMAEKNGKSFEKRIEFVQSSGEFPSKSQRLLHV